MKTLFDMVVIPIYLVVIAVLLPVIGVMLVFYGAGWCWYRLTDYVVDLYRDISESGAFRSCR